MQAKPRKVLAISSGGGHWIQLKRLLPAFEGARLFVATTEAAREREVEAERFLVVPDASRWSRARVALSAFRMAWICLTLRPHVVVSTGAAPGLLGLACGKLLGARTIWVDSIANAEELSLSGAKAGRFADLWLTQWPHLARPGGPDYAGSVL